MFAAKSRWEKRQMRITPHPDSIWHTPSSSSAPSPALRGRIPKKLVQLNTIQPSEDAKLFSISHRPDL
jgi:predicted oxidoreductase